MFSQPGRDRRSSWYEDQTPDLIRQVVEALTEETPESESQCLSHNSFLICKESIDQYTSLSRCSHAYKMARLIRLVAGFPFHISTSSQHQET